MKNIPQDQQDRKLEAEIQSLSAILSFFVISFFVHLSDNPLNSCENPVWIYYHQSANLSIRLKYIPLSRLAMGA